MVEYHVNYRLDEIFPRVARRLFFQFSGRLIVLVAGGWVLFIALLLISDSDRLRNALLAGLVVLTLLLFASYRSFRRLATPAELPRMVLLTLSEDSIRTEFGENESRYAWTSLRGIHRYPEAWVIELIGKQFLFVPIDQMSEGLRCLLESKSTPSE